MIQIGIIEQHQDFRYNLTNFLNKQTGMRCALATATTDSFMKNAQTSGAFHVILQEIAHEDKSNFGQIRKLKKAFPTSQVITFTKRADSDSIVKALYAGAGGYLTKGTSLSKIKEAVVDTYKGAAALSPAVARKLVDYFTPKKHPIQLTNKEQQIVQCLTDGYSYKMAADHLGITMNTFNYHIKNVYRKLGVHSKSEVVAMRLKGMC